MTRSVAGAYMDVSVCINQFSCIPVEIKYPDDILSEIARIYRFACAEGKVQMRSVLPDRVCTVSFELTEVCSLKKLSVAFEAEYGERTCRVIGGKQVFTDRVK